MYGTTAISLGEKNIKKVLQIAALLDMGNEISSPAKIALDFAIELALDYAKNYVKGDTGVLFCEPSQVQAVASNPEFFRALCEEGVIEWLEPLVLAGKVNRSGNVQT
jgi:hypothetical protein